MANEMGFRVIVLVLATHPATTLLGTDGSVNVAEEGEVAAGGYADGALPAMTRGR